MRISRVTPNYQFQNNKNMRNNNAAPSFKGTVPQPVVKGLSKFYDSVAANGGFKKFIKNFSLSDNTFTHLLVAESCFLSGFYMINTLRNDKISKEQKPQMLINDALTLGVSTAGAYLVEDKITNVVMKGAEKHFEKNKSYYMDLGKKVMASAESTPKGELLSKVGEVVSKSGDELSKGIDDVAAMIGKHAKNLIAEEGKFKAFQIGNDKLASVQNSVKDAVRNNAGNADKAKEAVAGLVDDIYNSSAARAEADKILPGINKLKVLVIFGIIYRYIGPVVITPIANKISSKFFDKKADKTEKPQEKK